MTAPTDTSIEIIKTFFIIYPQIIFHNVGNIAV
jgi:hypothetical protein